MAKDEQHLNHDHAHSLHDHTHTHAITKNLKVAFVLNLGFTIIEIVGGLITNSMAILSDAIHDLGDSIAIGTALFLEKKSEQKRDQKFSYGYRRWSTLSALINVVILTAGSIVIIVETIPRLMSPQEVHTQGMILLGILGVFVNGIAVLRLKANTSSLNNRTVMLHLIEDALGWIAVLIGAIVMHFTQWSIIDPLLSLLIAAYILFNAMKNLRKIMDIFLQAVPKKLNLEKIETQVKRINGIMSVHDIHVWSLDGEFHVASLHLVVNEQMLASKEKVKQKVRSVFFKEGIKHVTVELEDPEENCEMIDCNT